MSETPIRQHRDAEDRRVHAELLHGLAMRLECSALRATLLLGHIEGTAPCRADRLAEFHQQVADDLLLAESLTDKFDQMVRLASKLEDHACLAALEATEKETAPS